MGIEKLSWQRGNRSILVAFDKNSAPGQEGQIVEIDHDEKTSKIEAWSTGSDITGDKVTPKNPRFTNLDGAQKMKLEKAVQHRNVYIKASFIPRESRIRLPSLTLYCPMRESG